MPLPAIVIRPIMPALSLVIAIGLVGAACGVGPTPAPAISPTARLQVVTTTAILADFVRNVGGDRVEVRSIVPPGTDVHSFQSTPADSIAIRSAKVIVSNGLRLDNFLDPVFKSAKRSDAVHVVAAEGLEAMPVKVMGLSTGTLLNEGGQEELQGRVYLPARGDPHFWQNPKYAVYYVERIRDGLIQADPLGAQIYEANSAAYIGKLRELDQEIVDTLSTVPAGKRHLVTLHDAFGHFAQRYGWRASAFIAGDASDVTPGRVIRVMERIMEEGIPAVFAEPQFNADVIQQAAGDIGVSVWPIYSNSLDDNVSTYIEMMRFNAGSLLRLKR